MKNYPHLYTPGNKKSSFSNQLKTHKKTTSILPQKNQYNKIPSSKTINHMNNPLSRRATNYPRINSRSIQQMHLDRSSQDNYDALQRKKNLLEDHRKLNSQFYHSPTFGQFGNTSYSNPKNNYYPHQFRNIDRESNDYNVQNNYQIDRYSIQSSQQSQLFQRSYQKIGQIKYHVHNKNIDHQLNEVLELIKQQKLRANQTVKTLKKAADHYKKICDTVTKSYAETAVNTEQQISYFKQTESKEISIQCERSDQKIITRQSSPTFSKVVDESVSSKKSSGKKIETQQKQQKIDGKQKQIYLKLATMLQDMKIDARQILPQDIELNFQVKDYKNLTEAQVIKIQKFFIKKLVQKIPK